MRISTLKGTANFNLRNSYKPTKILLGLLCLCFSAKAQMGVNLFYEDFSNYKSERWSSAAGAHSEYHFTAECQPIGQWQISSFYHDLESARAWKVLTHQGEKVLAQSVHYGLRFTHPMVVAGDPLWENYEIDLRLATPDTAQAGICVRYQNSRCYYFVGVHQNQAEIKKMNHASGFHQPNVTILAKTAFEPPSDLYYHLKIVVKGDQIELRLPSGQILSAVDTEYPDGRIALLSDGPAYFSKIEVNTSADDERIFASRKKEVETVESNLQSQNPAMSLHKKIRIQDFGVGRNLRFGDLDNDGVLDVLVGQVVHHGPQDAFSEISCMTALTLEGAQLWRVGKPDRWKDHLTNDVAFQIHDLDGDGKTEVIYTMNEEIIVADGATGKTKYKAPTPFANMNALERNRALVPPTRLLGDCLFFADFRGKGRDQDIVIKDRYRQYWVLDDQLQLLWSGSCRTGHYPYAYDIDDDGRDEMAIGYSLIDDDGSVIWSLDEEIQDHADGIAIVPFQKGKPLKILCAASDEGMFFADLAGNIQQHYYVGHAQNPIVANLRDDLPGLESLSINFWGNQGIINLYDAEGRRYKEFEPVQHGSMCLPVNWNGSTEEFFLLSANVEQGGLYDGYGQRALLFPDDGHPDLCNAVMDIYGDARDEIVVWDEQELWVYTQEDNPRTTKVYQPIRNPLYNYSNYQTTVSLPPDYVR